MNARISSLTLAAVLAVAQAVSVSVSGCASTAIRVEEIPEALIAFVYYDTATARKRAEKAREGIEARTGVSTQPQIRGVARMDDLAAMFQRTIGVASGDDVKLRGRLALLDPRTGSVTRVDGARPGAVPQDWSSDHERLLFSQVVHNDLPQIFELEVATGLSRRLTYGRTAHPEGCYGPDGSVVITSVDTTSQVPAARILLTDRDGAESTQLSGSGYAYYPACSPDGSAVAFTTVEQNGKSPRIQIRSPIRTGVPRVLTRGLEPAFSSDGDWIAFSAKIKEESTIWLVRPDGTARKSLGRGGYDEHRPSLSPDNRLVVYVADTRYHQQLYLRRIDGTGNRVLLADGDGDRPVW